MESITENHMYTKIADNIKHNIDNINRLLADCSIQSKVVSQEKQIAEFLSLDVDSLIKNEPKSDYYDLNQVTKIFDLLGSSKYENKKRNKIHLMAPELRSSQLSLTSSSLSIDDVTNSNDYSKEVKSHLTEIRKVLESISNSTINVPDLSSLQKKETGKNSSFVELFTKLQKLSKELQSIASTDNLNETEETINIDEKLVADLNKLNEVRDLFNHFNHLINFLQILSDINHSQTNHITQLPIQDNCSFKSTYVINEILEAIDNNPL